MDKSGQKTAPWTARNQELEELKMENLRIKSEQEALLQQFKQETRKTHCRNTAKKERSSEKGENNDADLGPPPPPPEEGAKSETPLRDPRCGCSQVVFAPREPRQTLRSCEREGIVGGDEAPVGGVAQVVSHGVKVVGVHGEEGKEKDEEVR